MHITDNKAGAILLQFISKMDYNSTRKEVQVMQISTRLI